MTKKEDFIALIDKFGCLSSTAGTFGSPTDPTTLLYASVHDEKQCPHCSKTIIINREDVPWISTLVANTSNGMAAGLRTLIDKDGVRHDKPEGSLIFYGIGDPKPTRKAPPKNVLKHYDDLVAAGNITCRGNGCSIVLCGAVDAPDRNWEIDHVSDMANYHDNKFRRDVRNYQALCVSCNDSKRELRKHQSS